jgi:hypothetical protein
VVFGYHNKQEDLTFMKPFAAGNWYRRVTPDTSVINYALDTTATEAAYNKYMVEDWSLTGSSLQKFSEHAVAFYTNGTDARKITVPREGLYRLAL